MQQITILGSTGSVGVSTLDVVARHPELYSVFALSGRSSVATLAEQCARFQPTYAVVMDANAAAELRHMLSLTSANKTEVLWGVDALCQVSAGIREHRDGPLALGDTLALIHRPLPLRVHEPVVRCD